MWLCFCTSFKGSCGERQGYPLPSGAYPSPSTGMAVPRAKSQRGCCMPPVQRCALHSSMPLCSLKGDTTELPLPKKRQHHGLKGHLETKVGAWQGRDQGKGSSPGVMELKLSEGSEQRMEFLAGGCIVPPPKAKAGLGCGAAWLQRAHEACSKGHGSLFCSRG